MGVVTRGEREVSLRFETFPTRLQQKLEVRIRALTAELDARVKAATPVRTGLLRSEITPKVYTSDGRVAGYVSVYASGRTTEYAKAATLEYGSNKARKLSHSRGRILGLFSRKKHLTARLSKVPHIEAFRYLRGPLEEMRPEVEAGLDEVLAEAATEDEA